MSDEFDDLYDAPGAAQPLRQTDARRSIEPARLVSRLYGAAGHSLRARLLERLLRPLGSLGVAAVAGGAFAGFLRRLGGAGIDIGIDDVARISRGQVLELARFVEQCSPQTLHDVAALLGDNPLGATAFATSVTLLLARALSARGAARVTLNPAALPDDGDAKPRQPDQRPR